TQDNGTWAYSGSNSSWFESVGGDGGPSGINAVAPAVRMHSYTGAQMDVNFQGTSTTGWNWVSDPLLASGEAASFYAPLLADLVRDGSWFVGLQRVWRTQDNGGARSFLEQHGNEFTGDFTVACGDWNPLGTALLTGSAYGADKGGSYVVAIARAPALNTPLWVATRLGRLMVSMNADGPAAAVTFKRIDTAAQPSRFISGLAIDPANPLHAFVSFSGYDAYTPGTPGHVFEVSYNPVSGTASWTDRSAGLGDQPVTGIAYDPRTGRLYAATDFGVAVLLPNAPQWLSSAAGKLPPVAVYGLSLDSAGRVLYAATHGRGIWSLPLSDAQR
ncbi:MAG: exo-alpha-sialidase, partial [Rhodoferax sp.]|nr:exo-alpha-sialidase [Rhodoferax sp.]